MLWWLQVQRRNRHAGALTKCRSIRGHLDRIAGRSITSGWRGISQFDLAQPLRGEKIYRVVTQARGVGSA
jgi:hypothetical protein